MPRDLPESRPDGDDRNRHGPRNEQIASAAETMSLVEVHRNLVSAEAPDGEFWRQAFALKAHDVFRTALQKTFHGLQKSVADAAVSDATMQVLQVGLAERIRGNTESRIRRYLTMMVVSAVSGEHEARERRERSHYELSLTMDDSWQRMMRAREQVDVHQLVEAALESMTRRGQSHEVYLLRLRHVQGLTCQEMLELIGEEVSVVSLQKRIERARNELRRALNELAS